MKKYSVYYRIFGGVDALFRAETIEEVKRAISYHSESDFEYIKVCIRDEDGEMCTLNNFDEIMEAK